MTMSVLQELNGRGAPNPLGCFQGECLYDPNGFGLDRWLRADLVVNTSRLNVASARLGRHYSWRHRNWLECKFMRQRNQGPVTNKTQVTAGLAADLVRLAVLIPEAAGVASSSGRYLLQVYDRRPSEYIARTRYQSANGPSAVRLWTDSLIKAGRAQATLGAFNLEPDTFQNVTGQLRALQVDLSLTSLAIEPLALPAPETKLYWCYLTRLDEVYVELDGRSFTIAENRAVTEAAPGDLGWIRSHIAGLLHKVEREEHPPEDPLEAEDLAIEEDD